MGAWAACGTNGPSAHPERGRPGCGQPEVGSARPGQQPGMAANKTRGVKLADIDEVIGNVYTMEVVIGQILARANVHASIYLSAVSTDNLPIHFIRQLCSKSCFTTRRRSQYGQQIIQGKQFR